MGAAFRFFWAKSLRLSATSRRNGPCGIMGPVTDPLTLTRFKVEQYRCIESCELKLTRLHALVGPNDSGKSTLLAALELGQRLFSANAFLLGGPSQMKVELEWSSGLAVLRTDEAHEPRARWLDNGRGVGLARPDEVRLDASRTSVGRARLVRLDPDEMRKPAKLIPTAGQLEFNERGLGLPAVYDALLARKRRVFDAIEQKLISLFPQVESLVLLSESDSHKQIGVQLRGRAQPIDAPNLSEGMLYFLAFQALEHLSPTPLLLVEEPENGLHPARIVEMVSVLREVSKTTQVVLATHCPLVINELDGSEVSIITRDDHGTHAKLLSETANYEERSSVYKNGEIWLSFGDGVQERELIEGTTST